MREAGGTYRVASGENLPFADASADAILYMKSFHHLPLAAMPLALSEAARVLAPQGRLIVIEPLAEGNYFEAMRPIEDETEVRAAAYTALQNPPPPLLPDGELVYDTAVRPRDANHFIEVIIAADPARRERLPRVESELGGATKLSRTAMPMGCTSSHRCGAMSSGGAGEKWVVSRFESCNGP